MMKKLLLMAAAAFTAWSCTTGIDEVAPSVGLEESKICVTVNMPNPDTRLSFVEDAESGALSPRWSYDEMTWAGDELGAWFEDMTLTPTFFIMSTSEDHTSASFAAGYVGDNVPESLRLIYPYKKTNITDDALALSFADQKVDLADETYTKLGDNTYMITSDVELSNNGTMFTASEEMYMQHINTAINVGLKFSNLPAENLSITSIAISGADGAQVPVSGSADLTKEVSEDGFAVATEYGSIAALVSNSGAVVDGEVYNAMLTTLPFVVSAGQSLEVEVVLSDDENSYTKTFSVSPEEKTYFYRATYTSVNYACDMTDAVKTEKAVAIKVSDILPAALMVSMNVELDYELCDGYAWESCETANVGWSYFEIDLNNGNASVITEDGALVAGSDYYLTPNTSYTFQFCAVTGSEETGYTPYGEIVKYTATTSAAVIGTSEYTVEIKIDDAQTSLTGFGGLIYNNENVAGYYYDNVAKADLGDGSVEDYITDNDLLGTLYPLAFYGYDYDLGANVDAESKKFTASSKKDGTEYVAFAIAIDNNGNIGNVSVAEVTTTSLKVDDTLEPIVTVTPDATSAEFKFEFNNCAKILKYNIDPESTYTTEDKAYDYLIGDITKLSYGWASDGTTNSYYGEYSEDKSYVTYTEKNLQMGKSYVMYYIGVGADGSISEFIGLEYTTSSPTFGACDASVSVSLSGQAYYQNDPELYPEYKDNMWVEADVEVTLENGATSYTYGVFDKAYITNHLSMDAWGLYLIGTYYNKVTTSETSLSGVYIGNTSYRFVVVAMDADGNYGTPQVFEFKDWDNVMVKPDGGDTGGDIAPLAE